MAPKKQAKRATGKGAYMNKGKRTTKRYGVNDRRKGDSQSVVCSTFVDIPAQLIGDGSPGQKYGNGYLVNAADVPNNNNMATGAGFITAAIALSPNNGHLTCVSDNAYRGLFNQYRPKAIYLDIMFNKKLRDTCENVLLLVEKNNDTTITTLKQMVSDPQHKLYRLGQNTQSIRFTHKFTDDNDKLWKNTTDTNCAITDTHYLKILCPVNNQGNGNPIPAGDLQITMRVKFAIDYKDMKVLTAANIPLN